MTVREYGSGSLKSYGLEYKSSDTAYRGTDTFRYTVTDQPPAGGTPLTTSEQTATMGHRPAPPQCLTGSLVDVRSGRSRNLSLTCMTQDWTMPVTYRITDQPDHGTLTFSGQAGSSTVVYRPADGYSGTDSFSYDATNANGTSQVATRQLRISPTYNSVPSCYSTSAWGGTPAGLARRLSLLCTDEDGDALTYSIVDGPAHRSSARWSSRRLGRRSRSWTTPPPRATPAATRSRSRPPTESGPLRRHVLDRCDGSDRSELAGRRPGAPGRGPAAARRRPDPADERPDAADHGHPAAGADPRAAGRARPCSTLAKSKQAACAQQRKLDAALATCSKLKGAKQTACAKQAKAVSKCDPLKGKKKSACVAKARKR